MLLKAGITHTAARPRGEVRGAVIVLFLLALSLLGVAVLLFTTHQGIGTSPDSVAYIHAARILSGGLEVPATAPRDSDFSMVHHAPFYSILLSYPGMAGIDPLVAARWLNSLLFGANMLLVGLLIFRESKRAWTAFLGSFLLLTSVVTQSIHAHAWSEPTFILLNTLGFVALARYLENSKYAALLAASILVGLACITRYAGLPLIATGTLGILLLSKGNYRRRITASALFTLVSALPLALWVVRNLVVAGSATNRSLVFHPIGKGHLWQALYTISSWLQIPSSAPSFMHIFAVGVVLVGAALPFAWIQWEQIRTAGHRGPETKLHLSPLLQLLALFVVNYAVFLVLSISFVDANTPLDDRILSPVYVSGLIVVLLLAQRWWTRNAGRRPVQEFVFISLMLLFMGLQLGRAVEWVQTHRESGLGFSSVQWRHSDTLGELSKLREDLIVVSNIPEAILLHTGRPASALPREVFAVTQQSNERYAADLARLKADLLREGGVVVYFDSVPQRLSPREDDLVRSLSLYPLTVAEDGAVYVVEGVNPELLLHE